MRRADEDDASNLMTEERNPFCDSLQPRLAAFALGEAPEDADLEAHLAGCASCQGDLQGYRQVARVLPYAAPDLTPPRELRERILAAATQHAGGWSPATPDISAGHAARRGAPWRLPRMMWLPIVSAGLALALLLGWNVNLRSQLDQRSAQVSASRDNWQTMTRLLNDPTVRALPLAGQGADGRVWVTERGEVACLVVEGLPHPGDGKVYQVWLQSGDQVTSAATFVPQNGGAWTFLRADRPIKDFQTVGVTIEPRGGSAIPTGDPILNGSLQAAAIDAAIVLK